MADEGLSMNEPIVWLSTKEASERLGITLRSLYRFIDEGDLVAYKFGRVIRIQEPDVDKFIEASRISPGDLEHLYPEVKGNGNGTGGTVHGMVDAAARRVVANGAG
jgi:excisionase family DNA binding protein